jgi:hypothetical protein
MKLYLLYYDHDYGDRENWNTFYTPCEVFDSAEKRQARIGFIEQQVNEDGEPLDYDFYEVDTELMTDELAKEWSND